MSAEIRPMRASDVDFAVTLTNVEGWDYGPEDFQRFRRMDPQGTLVAWAGETPVGITTATAYERATWIGNVIVAPEERGKGYGRDLVARALKYGEEQGTETTWLNAYANVEGFYEDMGFQAVGRTVRYEGKAEGRLQGEPRLVHMSELDVLSAFDRPHFGNDRSKVLAEFYHDYGEAFFVWSEEGLQGYAVGARYPEGMDVAPWVASSARPDVAEGLLLHLIAAFPGRQVGVAVPEENEAALRLMRDLGFEPAFETIRMAYGPGTGGIDPKGIFGLGGLEKG
ncbi:MAG: GNAT family N-acetyltransferase [Thermoplasmata archaeon]